MEKPIKKTRLTWTEASKEMENKEKDSFTGPLFGIVSGLLVGVVVGEETGSFWLGFLLSIVFGILIGVGLYWLSNSNPGGRASW